MKGLYLHKSVRRTSRHKIKGRFDLVVNVRTEQFEGVFSLKKLRASNSELDNFSPFSRSQ